MDKISETGLYDYLVQKKVPGLKENVTYSTLKKGQLLYNTSQHFTDIYEIITGAVKLGGLSVKEEEYIYEIITPGEIFGNLAVLGDTFSEFCKSITATRIRIYKLEFFKYFMLHDPQVAEWCFSKIVFRWNKTESMLINIRSHDQRERIQLLYASLQRKIMTAANKEVALHKLVTFKDMADLTASTRQLVADTLKNE